MSCPAGMLKISELLPTLKIEPVTVATPGLVMWIVPARMPAVARSYHGKYTRVAASPGRLATLSLNEL